MNPAVLNPHAVDVAAGLPGVVSDFVASAPAFGAELIVCGTIVGLLLVRLFGLPVPAAAVAFGGSVAATCAGCVQWGDAFTNPVDGWGGLVRNDALAVFARVLILLAWNLTVTLTLLTGVPRPAADDRDDDGADFHVPSPGPRWGADDGGGEPPAHAVPRRREASVPAYILVGFRKNSRAAGEAALKYSCSGPGPRG